MLFIELIPKSITGLPSKNRRLKEAGEEAAVHLLHTVHKVLFNVEALTERLNAQGGCVCPQWERTCAGTRVWGTAWILAFEGFMDGRRTLTCVITSGCSEPGDLIYWLQGGTEQLLQSFTLCVCMCVCVCRCFLGHGVSVATCIVFVAMCCFEWICV